MEEWWVTWRGRWIECEWVRGIEREREREEGGWWLFFTQLVLLIGISSQGLDAISSLHSAKQNEAKNICDSAQRWRTRTHGHSIQMAYAQSGSGASSIHNAAQAGCRGKRTYWGFGLWHMRLPVLTCVSLCMCPCLLARLCDELMKLQTCRCETSH